MDKQTDFWRAPIRALFTVDESSGVHAIQQTWQNIALKEHGLPHPSSIHRGKSDDDKGAFSSVFNSFYEISRNETIILITKYATDDFAGSTR